MKSPIILLGIIILSIILIYSCEKNSTGFSGIQIDDDPEIIYIARKFINQGWGVAVSLNIMDGQGRNHKELISVSDGYVKEAYFSTDGEKILFVMHSDSMGSGENLYVMNYDGSNLLQITVTDTTIAYFAPQFTPDESKVIYLAIVNHQGYQIRMFDMISKEHTILVHETYDGRRPIVSHDGSFLFYNNIDYNVHRILLDGLSDEKLTNLGYTSQIQLSGDGRTVYFVSQIDHLQYDLFSMTLEGENIRRVTTLNNSSTAYFRISQDESKILSLLSPSGTGQSVAIMNSNGSNLDTTYINKDCFHSFEFFPDNKNIIFEVYEGENPYSVSNIYRINVSGEDLRKLSHDKYFANKFECFRP